MFAAVPGARARSSDTDELFEFGRLRARSRIPMQFCHPPVFARYGGNCHERFRLRQFRTSALPAVGDRRHLALQHHPFGTRCRISELAIYGNVEPTMDPIEEFHRHADECRRMARVVRDRQSRDTWNSMAERWLRCAAEFQTAMGSAKKSSSRHRRTGGWASGLKPQREQGEEPRH
jgi:hypothetical protein